jgi:Fur family transcriptional regulator, peroxide stress response regulator
MTKQTDTFLQALKQAGHRITPQRQAICEYLAATHKHPTPYQVYADLSIEHPEISRATVYNTLNTLQSLGAIVEINLGEEHTHYDTNSVPHINLICLRCHQIIDYAGDLPLEDLQNVLKAETGFQPVAAKIDILGFCQSCQQQRKTEIRAQWRAQTSSRKE